MDGKEIAKNVFANECQRCGGLLEWAASETYGMCDTRQTEIKKLKWDKENI